MTPVEETRDGTGEEMTPVGNAREGTGEEGESDSDRECIKR